ncbi:MAG: hypothetical protein JWN01_493 [Patescibacteria group bacterium]|nr:hypothetical protein [Patescibacteria group bacterium]
MRVRPSSLALLEGTLGLIVGLAVGILGWVGAAQGFDLNFDILLRGLMLGMTPGLAAVIALTLVYAALGTLVGYAHGELYNRVAGWTERAHVTDDAAAEEPAAQPKGSRIAGRRGAPTFGETIGRRRDK